VQGPDGSRNVQLERGWAVNEARCQPSPVFSSGTRNVAVLQNATLFPGGLIDMPFIVATAQRIVFFDLVDHPRR
jgi:hypothetical protein